MSFSSEEIPRELPMAFAEGVRSVAIDHGLSEKDAEGFVLAVCKEAASRRRSEDDDEEDTWWNRNKHWALPSSIGLAAFLLGADAGNNGDKDKNYFSRAGGLFWDRLKALVGYNNDPYVDNLTNVKKVP